MKVEINFNSVETTILKKISDYSEIDINTLCKGLIINHIENFDSKMQEFIEENIPEKYYDEYTGRYIE